MHLLAQLHKMQHKVTLSTKAVLAKPTTLNKDVQSDLSLQDPKPLQLRDYYLAESVGSFGGSCSKLPHPAFEWL